MKRDQEVEQGFYQTCAELLGAKYTYKPFPYTRATRWNNRTAGNGRFEGHGIIRMFGERAVVVQLHTPRCSGTFYSMESALDAIRAAKSG
jgi:hypothetical protein